MPKTELSEDKKVALFQKEGFIEEMVRESRIPVFIPGSTGTEITEFDILGKAISKGHLKPIVFCFIPPEGTEKGDSVKGSASFGFEFFSPDGKSRGYAAMYTLTPDQAAEAKQKIIKIAQKKQS